jgi:thiamine biosynthesis lipoprotein
MGTSVRIVLYCASRERADQASEAAFRKIARLDATMSDYNEASELNNLCRGSAGRWVKVSADLFRILSISQRIARQTNGAFDVTAGPIVKLWRRAIRAQELPDRDRIGSALALTGFEKIELDSRARSVRLLSEGMQLDLGGIAKGYAADEAMRVLRRHRIVRALIAIGGDIRAGSPPPGRKGWEIEVRGSDPWEMTTVTLSDCGISTSGDLEQFVEIGGIRYAHIVNPKTGTGVIGPLSATVIAPTATLSDALATALCVMESERGLRLIDSLRGAAALIYRSGEKGIERRESKRRFRKLAED